MQANLTLFYSSKVYLNLLENIPLEDIDKITTMYENEEEIITSPDFKDKVEKFYIYTTNYRRAIKNPQAKRPKLVITYYDAYDHFNTLRVLYQKESIKLNPKKVVNAIKRALKEANNSQIVLSILNEHPSIFESQHNIIYNKLFQIKRILKNTISPPENLMSQYNKLLKIITEDLLRGYEKNTNTVTPTSYYHIRLVDEFIEIKKNLSTIPKNNINISKPNITTLTSNITLQKPLSPKEKVKKIDSSPKKSFCSISDYYLEISEQI